MYPFLTRYRQNFGKINQEGSVKRCQDKVLRKLTTAAATTRLRLCRKRKKHVVKSRALTICMENSEIPGRIQMELFIPVEIFRKKSNAFRGITFFPFLPKRPKFVVPFVWINLPRESENFTGILSTVQLNPVPVFGGKKIPVPFDRNFPPKFSCKW